MEGALVDGAVAEEAERDVGRLAKGCGQRRARGEAEAAADDAVGAQHAEREVGDVHRAAAAGAGAGRLAVELGHHRADADALGDGVAVAAVGRGDQVARFERGAAAGRHRFLADIGMGEAGHLAREVVGEDALLEEPDAHHRPVHRDQLVARGDIGLFRLVLPVRGRAHIVLLLDFLAAGNGGVAFPQSIGSTIAKRSRRRQQRYGSPDCALAPPMSVGGRSYHCVHASGRMPRREPPLHHRRRDAPGTSPTPERMPALSRRQPNPQSRRPQGRRPPRRGRRVDGVAGAARRRTQAGQARNPRAHPAGRPRHGLPRQRRRPQPAHAAHRGDRAGHS